MAKKTPITVTLMKGKHPTQPWTFDIDKPGPGPKVTKKERYAQKWNAKRAAVRLLDAWYSIDGHWHVIDGTGTRKVVFVTKNK